MLTVVMPTRNRPRHCAGQLRFLRDNRLAHPILVLDSSDPGSAEIVRAACVGVAEYRHFRPDLRLVDKLVGVIETIRTPFVILTPDDDIAFPHAIEAALAHLDRNEDYVAAQGYTLDLA